MQASRLGRVSVRVNEPGQDRFLTEVNFPGPSGGEVQYIVGANSNEPLSADGHSFCPRQSRIDRPEMPVVKDQVRFGALERFLRIVGSKRSPG